MDGGLDDLHDAEWMAKRIRKPASWVVKNTARIPHQKIGRDVWFTERNLADYLEATRITPGRMQTTGPRRRRTA